jgi:hypothetical protein
MTIGLENPSDFAEGTQVSENCIVVGHSSPKLLFNIIEKEQLASIPCHDRYTFNPGIDVSQTSLLVRCNGVLFVGSRSLRSQLGDFLFQDAFKGLFGNRTPAMCNASPILGYCKLVSR